MLSPKLEEYVRRGDKFQTTEPDEEGAKDLPVDKITYGKFEYNPLQALKD